MCIRDSPRTMCSLSQCAELLSGVIHGAERVGDQNSETLQHVIQLMTSGTTPIHGSSVRDVSKWAMGSEEVIKPCKLQEVEEDSWANMPSFSVDELSMLLDEEPEFTCADPDSPAPRRPREKLTRKRSRDEGCNEDEDEDEAPDSISILDCCSHEGPAYEEYTDHTSKRVKAEASPVHTATVVTNEAQLPYAAEFVQMSFDAMAHIDCRTGSVVWANNAFGDLTTTVGRGNPLEGLQALQTQFLQQLPRGLCSRSGHVASVELWSATQLVGEPGQEIVLWSIQHSANRQSAPTPSRPRSCSEESLTTTPLKLDKPFPEANEFVDLRCEMRLTNPSKGKPPVQMLWRKYGQKSLLPPPVTPDSAPHVPKDRLYYKCTQKDCCAKLRVDVDRASGEHVSMIATGTHCHHIVLV
eukprot:TRINITY_DN2833_c0_g1_i4.p1 TRINITY_DN2833_c0_g1~~TRINITY_DN2833_c0_g1_i4.p1  ORF type:complete len:411 (+),score=96.94 TRINITY_DN2833_c0_g1_i4:140-1372(+)